ncbi:MAG: hypothetical protein HC834_08735 [Rhodospirillales bacterium]|nr:hypothetical protein [Rhodospirillales bacterium]
MKPPQAPILLGFATLLIGAISTTAFSGAFDSGADHEDLHRRAADHDTWMREHLMPAGGVMSAQFTDDTYAQVKSYGGERDPAIWTGAYLAAQALRLQVTGDADAADQVAETVRVLHRWWRISGMPAISLGSRHRPTVKRPFWTPCQRAIRR